ncbi:hypothetical protein QK289_15825 [Exiguobacterium antarcticum]|uniref:Uncharacterized protein n=1 Tax=Exiguobacterium antarcticum TaxID=132920 RepID=A0ABT6R6A0_9BACL|nr:hypothetical protein [Exiguobacterium antarcticum]MDI3236481.1 hypothetical protein [Exiguobacterium antarcticum]
MTLEDEFDPSELKGVVIRNHDPEYLAAIAKLKKIQMSDNYSHKIETLQVDKTGHILLDPENPNHLEWMQEDE